MAGKRKRGGGRPTKRTEETEEKILTALRAGNFRNVACWFAGVSPRVMRDWMKEGAEKPDSAAGSFRRRVLEAEKTAEIRAVGLIMKAAGNDARHAEWWLERKFPERWGRREKHEVTGQGGKPIKVQTQHDFRNATDDDLAALEGLVTKITQPGGDSGGEV